jgi:hypothetical protein
MWVSEALRSHQLASVFALRIKSNESYYSLKIKEKYIERERNKESKYAIDWKKILVPYSCIRDIFTSDLLAYNGNMFKVLI